MTDLVGDIGCQLAGPGRGDCAHFVGLPGHTIEGVHDGSDATVDVYGKPNGWCWSCWKDLRIERLTASRDGEREAREKCAAALIEKDKAMGVLFDRLRGAGVDFSDLIS